MSEGVKPSLRIDWFDGTLIEDTRPNASSSSHDFGDNGQPQAQESPIRNYTEKKPIGFKRLLDLSTLTSPILSLEIANRPGFWNLLDTELKGDFLVLITKILANIYISLLPGEKSKIITMLKTKFEKSNFLEMLKVYLIGLPSVRLSEKRMNSHLWDNVQSFYFNVVSLCEGIFNFGGHSIEYLKDICNLLEITETSALGVTEEHMETFHESFYERIVCLKEKIQDFISKVQYEKPSIKNPEVPITDINSFKNISIFPSKSDLTQGSNYDLQPNIVNGCYTNIKEYLDLQFKLLREDCFGPLREGICKYLENPYKRRHENLRVYPKVRIIRTYITNNKVGHLVDIAWQDRFTTGRVDSKKYAHRRHLMFGSLLLFTSDNFETILCATVLDSKPELLAECYLAVSFHNPVSSKIFSEVYLMVESEVFFEPYHRVLKVIQDSSLTSLPMSQYIVNVQKQTHPPEYLSSDTRYSIRSKNKSEISFPVLDEEQWPDKAIFGLDKSQMEAFKFALTREFAVIQGPPGTGKTHIGIKIASMLLNNMSLDGTPMLVICYTNHALDQFLEGILPITKNIVRLGSQSKSKVLESYTLNSMRTKMKSKYSYLYASKRSELEKIYQQMTKLQTEIEKCKKEVLSYKSIKPYLNSGKCELRRSKEDPVLPWLFDHLEAYYEKISDDEDDDVDDWENQAENLAIQDTLETCFSEQWALTEIDSMNNSVRYVQDVTEDNFEALMMTEKLENRMRKVRKRMNYFKKRLLVANKEGEIKFETDKDLNELPTEEKWKAYFSAVRIIKTELMCKMNDLVEQHAACTAELEEVSALTDCEVARAARVVGLTTAAAARRHRLLARLQSPIVIVEEAAEILEAHVVASLTDKCQHLIMIGDHKQLRPTAAHYKLARDYNLEISLFERMIRNGVHARTLTTQRRMRPNIAELLTPNIYERLDCHPSVHQYADVRGMKDNLYFFCHDTFEDSDDLEDSWRHKNTLEAKWCVALANYLRRMNYTSEEITILATYAGQATLIRELSKAKKYKLLLNVKITVVDNYQGEENRIVILSLVRSNSDGKIGFLSAVNRICVALSRAKEGFYIFGNMNMLKSASATWRSIHGKLAAQGAIGRSLALTCAKHNNTLEVDNSDRLDDCANGGPCSRICEKQTKFQFIPD